MFQGKGMTLQILFPFLIFLNNLFNLRPHLCPTKFLTKVLNLILHLQDLKGIIITDITFLILLKLLRNRGKFLLYIFLLDIFRY